MRICIAGEFSGEGHEGFKNIAANLSRELSQSNQVLNFDLQNCLSARSWSGLRTFHPHVVHYIPGRTIKSYALLGLLAGIGGARAVMSAFHSDIMSVPPAMVKIFRPDLILTQADWFADAYLRLGCSVAMLPNGVDTEKFRPCRESEKRELRSKYGVPDDRFVVLHAGHLIPARNLHILPRIQSENRAYQAILAASLYRKPDRKLLNYLLTHGVRVWRQVPYIEEVFTLADCYIFPTGKHSSILMPLSVLEAMSCNLPVISSRFDGLVRYFPEGDGVFYAGNENEFMEAVARVSSLVNVDTRSRVLPYSWNSVAVKLSSIYEQLVAIHNRQRVAKWAA